MTDSALRVVDLDLRLVGYFAAVAEHRHFGRAAAALRVAQPSLSRQIRRLEQQIGVCLFYRTPQSTRLTEAGEVFLPRAKALLDDISTRHRIEDILRFTTEAGNRRVVRAARCGTLNPH